MIEEIHVTLSEGSYPVLVGPGLLDLESIPFFRQAQTINTSRCAIITNPRVREMYADRVLSSLGEVGFHPHVIVIPDGERFKTLDTVQQIYTELIDAGLDRRSMVLALGGGVVGDVAGFAAATFFRGVPFVQVPTTLLAMVDASIGGKVAVDHPRGKNLIGAFKQPLAVIADTDTLASLPVADWRSGMGEVVKQAVIGDAGLFEELERIDPRSHVADWIGRAIRVKTRIVERDPLEDRERLHLNLGHTFGHAFEKLSDYTMRHGDGVAIGMVCAARLAARRNLCDPQLAMRIERLLSVLGLPVRVPGQMTADAIIDAMTTDKKRDNRRQRFIVPRALGDVVVVDDVTAEEIAEVLQRMPLPDAAAGD